MPPDIILFEPTRLFAGPGNHIKIPHIELAWKEFDPKAYIAQAVAELTAVSKAVTGPLYVGLSGGIDSAVTFGLCARARQTTGLIMFDVWDTPEEARAKEWFKQLNAEGHPVQMQQVRPQHITDALTKVVPLKYLKASQRAKGTLPTRSEQRVVGNMTARARMLILYAWANQHDGLVVGTGNACELYLGYFTKWGDGAADVLPLRHLLKSQVYAVARELGVPQSIMDAAPSAGLWAGQTDEQELGVTYAQVEAYLHGDEVDFQTADVIEHLHQASLHKQPRSWWD